MNVLSSRKTSESIGDFMYDLNNKFNTFYRKHVVLPKEKKTICFKRKFEYFPLKKDWKNTTKNGTDCQLIDHVVQGSVDVNRCPK